ncbi:hypothetical protein OXX79_005942 [Metschnikowia pulcherrima]
MTTPAEIDAKLPHQDENGPDERRSSSEETDFKDSAEEFGVHVSNLEKDGDDSGTQKQKSDLEIEEISTGSESHAKKKTNGHGKSDTEPKKEGKKATGQKNVSSDDSEIAEKPISVPQSENSAPNEGTARSLDGPQKLPPRTFIPVFLGTEPSTSIPSAAAEASSLLEARQSEISITFDAKDKTQQMAINSGMESVKKTYRDIRNTIGHLPTEMLTSERIDWAFWDRVMHDYHDTVVHEQSQLGHAVAAGIPEEVRGIVWQLVARSKNPQLEELYFHLKTEPSMHEKAIKRDLTRTSFYTNVDAANKAVELCNVILAYSNFDPDVGYTQGMVFIAVPLIMNMTESECFCLLVTLMKDYGLRDLFCPEMRGLHLLLHQFDRLLAQKSPSLYNHLNRQGVRSSMYASQWFLTFFSYKFPLTVVLRIFDMVITQGVEAVLRLGLNLMLKNEPSLLRLDFDGLITFLKDSLFNVYVSDEFVEEPNRRFSLLGRKPAKPANYKLDSFIHDSMQVDVSPLDLARWRVEFDQMILHDVKRAAEIEALRAGNGQLRHEIKAVETQMYALNHDHLEAVQGLVAVKVALPELLGDVSELRAEVGSLESDISELERKLGANQENIPQDIEAQIQELLKQNAEETEKFTSLEEQLAELTLQNEALKAELKKNKKWFWKK